MRLTADVILRARASLNPCKERELDLRGYKIPVIENMGVTQDQFDSIDFSDNEIRRVDNFPRSRRLSTLLLSNNHVTRIGAELGRQVPNLAHLILTNNRVAALSELDNLAACTNLVTLCLIDNPVARRQHYRLYAIQKIPSLKCLDFKKVKKEERETAERLFRSKAGRQMEADVAEEAKTFDANAGPSGPESLTAEQRQRLRQMIADAETPEEVDRLGRMLAAGVVPPPKKPAAVGASGGGGAGADEGAAAVAAVRVNGNAMAVDGITNGEAAAAAPAPAPTPEAAPAVAAAAAPVAPAATASAEEAEAVAAEKEVAAAPAPAAKGKRPRESDDNGDASAASGEEAVPAASDSQGEKAKAPPAATAEEEAAEDTADAAQKSSKGGKRGAKARRVESAEGNGDADAATEAADGVDQGGEGEGEAERVDGMEVEKGEGDDAATMSAEDIKAMKVGELKGELLKRGESTAGLKAALQRRLLDACGYTAE